MLLQGRVAVITGGRRGIGRALALAYAEEGADVAVCARTASEVARVAEEVRARGRSALAVTGDVAEVAEARRIVAEAEAGLGPIDLLVNNAGVFRVSPFLETSTEELDDMLRVNVRGVFVMTQAVLPGMTARGSGTIINLASLAGHQGYVGQTAYCASKHAILGLSKALALELAGTGVRISCLSPGGVDTELIARARPEVDRSLWMDPEDVARLAVLLASLPPKMAIDEVLVRRTASPTTAFA